MAKYKEAQRMGDDRRFPYDWSTQELKDFLGEFETELESYRTKVLSLGREFYGVPLDVIPAYGRFPSLEKPGTVRNPILGLTYPWIVQFYLDQGAITRKMDLGQVSWSIGPSLTNWRKGLALGVLRDRRSFAAKKERENMDILSESKESLVSSTKFDFGDVEG